jgi:uncharacterized Zn finger protein
MQDTCPTCNGPSEQVLLISEPDAGTGYQHYEFECQACGEIIVRTQSEQEANKGDRYDYHA